MKTEKMRQNATVSRTAAIEALLAGESQDAAARLAGVSRRSVVRWLADPDFVAELEQARTAAFSDALNCLKSGSAAAVKTLVQGLTQTSPAERRQSAREILTFAFKGVEVQDLEARLKRIEELLEAGAIAGQARQGRVS